MLSLEALKENADKRGMPSAKMRGVLREYIQIILLKSLYALPEGRKFCFTGGTYLRLVYGTKRFSEDLDFNGKGIDKQEFESVSKVLVQEMRKNGMKADVEFNHRDNLLIGSLSFPEVEKEYGIISKYSHKGFSIKIDMNCPKWKLIPESKVVSGYGVISPVICTQKGALFADKIDALLKKDRARHLYDIIFMLSEKFPVDEKVLKSLSLAGDPYDLILDRIKGCQDKQLKTYADQIRPFLFDEQDTKLILNAKTIVPGLISQNRHEPPRTKEAVPKPPAPFCIPW